MKRVCDICGCESDEYWMHSYYTGRKMMWLCWDCFKNSQREATKSDVFRQKKLYKINNSRKRNK